MTKQLDFAATIRRFRQTLIQAIQQTRQNTSVIS